MKYIFLLLLIICSALPAFSQQTNAPAYTSPEGEKEPGKTLYVPVSRNIKEPDSLATAGYFEKLKESYLSKEFVFLGNDKYNEHNPRDLVTGAIRYDIPEGTRLKCIDLLPPGSANNHILAIFHHPGYGSLSVCLHQGRCARLVPLAEYRKKAAKSEQLEKKYGRKEAGLIRQGCVAIGFTKQMCRESWGEPTGVTISNKKIGMVAEWVAKSKSGPDEEWIYSGTFSNCYLYFENDILTRFQY